MEAFLDAKKAGKIRFIGFTGHKDLAVHLRMLEIADEHQFHFDTVQMPINDGCAVPQLRASRVTGAGGEEDRSAGDEDGLIGDHHQ